MISPSWKTRWGLGASICASCFCDASAYSRRMRVRSAGRTHAYIGRLAADVLAFGIAPHIIQGCTKCLAICKRDTLVRRCRCCCVAGVARRRPSLIPACSGPLTGRVPTLLSLAKWDKCTFSITLLNDFQKFSSYKWCSLFLLLTKCIYRYRTRVNPFERK